MASKLMDTLEPRAPKLVCAMLAHTAHVTGFARRCGPPQLLPDLRQLIPHGTNDDMSTLGPTAASACHTQA